MMAPVKDSTREPGDALLHPLFWIALALLLSNDHLLKGARVLPREVTGKLSDFAGMLVAPVVIGALCRVRRRIGRLAVIACVAGLFSALKLSRSVADAVEAATAHTPMPWRLWCDWTDLMALSMLPLAWWLTGRTRKAMGSERPSVRALLRAGGFVVGGFACAATSINTEMYRGTAFVFNGTMRTQTLRLHRLGSPLDCARSLDAPADWPGPDAFVLESCTTLASREILGLDRSWMAVGKLGNGADFSVDPSYDVGVVGPTCDAVLLEAQGLAPVVIAWNGVKAIQFSGAGRFGDDPDDPHGLVLERAGERLFIEETSLLRVLPAGFAPATTACPNGER